MLHRARIWFIARCYVSSGGDGKSALALCRDLQDKRKMLHACRRAVWWSVKCGRRSFCSILTLFIFSVSCKVSIPLPYSFILPLSPPPFFFHLLVVSLYLFSRFPSLSPFFSLSGLQPLSLYLSNKHTHWPLSFSPIII